MCDAWILLILIKQRTKPIAKHKIVSSNAYLNSKRIVVLKHIAILSKVRVKSISYV